jgi:hypothetical protein
MELLGSQTVAVAAKHQHSKAQKAEPEQGKMTGFVKISPHV